MEKKEDALSAIEALNGTMYKGRQLAVELSKAQPLINQIMSSGNSSNPGAAAYGIEELFVFNCFAFEKTCLKVRVLIMFCASFSLQVAGRVFFQDHRHH